MIPNSNSLSVIEYKAVNGANELTSDSVFSQNSDTSVYLIFLHFPRTGTSRKINVYCMLPKTSQTLNLVTLGETATDVTLSLDTSYHLKVSAPNENYIYMTIVKVN